VGEKGQFCGRRLIGKQNEEPKSESSRRGSVERNSHWEKNARKEKSRHKKKKEGNLSKTQKS